MNDDWKMRAACAGAEPELFYSDQPFDQQTAIHLYCAHCPVIGSCLAAGAFEKYGIWGGTTPHQRAGRVRQPRGRPRTAA